jgi:hypothetical protein
VRFELFLEIFHGPRVEQAGILPRAAGPMAQQLV